MFAILFFISLLVHANCQQVLTYGLFEDNILSGFALINTTSPPINYPKSQLFATLDSGPSDVAVIGDTLVISGPFQYLENNPIGGILLFDTKDNTWSTLSVPDLFQGKPIYAISTISNYGDNKFLVVGYFNSTLSNTETIYNNVALCDVVNSNCSSLGEGLSKLFYSQNSAVTGIGQIGTTLYVGHLDDNNYHRVAQYNGGNVWNEILVLDPVDYFQLNSESLTVYKNNLFYVFGGSSGVYTACDNNDTMVIAMYNGECWTNFETPYQEVTYIASNDELLCVAYSSEQGFKTACWNDTTWINIPLPAISIISSITVISSDTIMLQVGIDTFHQAMVLVNIFSGIITIEPGTACPYPNNGVCVLSAEAIWCECDYGSQAILNSFDPTTGAYIINQNVQKMYSTQATLTSVCTSNEKIFVSGDFVKAGENFTPLGYALWDGSMWTTPDLPYLNNGSANSYNDIVCSSNGSSIWIAYLVYSNTTIVLTEIEEDYTIRYVSGVSQLYTGLQWLAVVNERVIINVQTILLSYDQLSWDLNYMNDLGLEGALIYAIHNVGDIIYLGGDFILMQKNFTYHNIAKKNITSGEWLFMAGTEGPVYDIISAGDYIYVAGEFKSADDISPVSDIVAANETGHWVSSLSGGIKDHSSLLQLLYGPNSALYALSTVGKIHMYQDNNWTHIESVFAAQIIGVTEFAPNSKSSSASTEASKDNKAVVWALLATMGGFLIIGIVVSVYHHFRKSPRRKGFERLVISQADIENNLQNLMDDPLINKIDENQIEFLNFIGRGGQGLVQRGKYRGQDVAIKSIVVVNDEQIINFIQEIKILSQVKHENIVQFIGIVVSKRSKIYLVTELMDTDLHSIKKKLNFQQKFAVAKDIAKAMNYLHKELKLLHRDLKPSNVLVSKDGICKLCDFGLARVNPEYSMTLSQNKGTVTYMAPEVLSTGHYNEKADVYSFGILLCELFGDHPFRHVKFEYSIQFEEQFMRREVEPHLPSMVPDDFLLLLQHMVAWDPKNRPSFEDIYPQLKQMYLTYNNL